MGTQNKGPIKINNNNNKYYRASYLAELGDNAEEVHLDEAVVELDDPGAVETAQQACFARSINRLVRLQRPHKYLLHHLPVSKKTKKILKWKKNNKLLTLYIGKRH